MEKVVVITRSFQSGTGEGGKPFNGEIFENGLVRPLRRLLKFDEVVQTIVVVINGESGNPLAEIPNSAGLTPTMIALQETFSKEIEEKRLLLVLDHKWGPNPGSATALNQGFREIAEKISFEWVLNWSPEIEMDGYRVAQGLAHAEKYNLSAVGFLRENWWERPQWNVIQNTAALWKREIFNVNVVGGFSPACNGTGRTIPVEGFGETPVAGMEDFHMMLSLLEYEHDEYNFEFRWGMVGRKAPLYWNTQFEPGSERERLHLRKIARQYAVMQIYAKDIFPEVSFHEVMNQLFTRYYQG
ncbi:MAG: hypothetical protein HYV47_00560 [Candidatus Nealsonbacteria bacterium]|nr:hypothetical protein [Candidatus Nealsonbacteria bacterium]